MRSVACFALLGLFAVFAFATEPSITGNRWDGVKSTVPGGPRNPGIPERPGGDDISTAWPIPGIPFHDSYQTCGFIDDYDETCPYVGTGAPDVVYSYTPPADLGICIDLCGSSYDTKVYVYEESAGNLIACNDDYCSGPNYPYAYLSRIADLMLVAGTTYYIVIDGYAAECGDYELDIDMCVPSELCMVPCPLVPIVEEEPGCGPGYVDVYNGGCNSTPPVFFELACGDDPLLFCGESGAWTDGSMNYRDTDWWSVTLTATKAIRFTTCASFAVQTFLIIPDPDCGNFTYPYLETADAYLPAVIEVTLDPGTYWYWIGPQWSDPVPCGSFYVSKIEGWCTGTSTSKTSWGSVKTLFR